MSLHEISCITDTEYPIITDFVDAHKTIIAAAKAEYAADPDSAEYVAGDQVILASISNEQHSAEMQIDARLLAGKGLRDWIYKKRQGRRPLSSVLLDVRAAGQEPLDILFESATSGRYMLEPMICAFPSNQPEATPKSGRPDDVLNALATSINQQFAHRDPLPKTPENDQRLHTATQAFIELGQDPNARVVLGPQRTTTLHGARATKVAAAMQGLKPELPEFRSADILTGDTEDMFGKRTFSTVPDDEGRQASLLFSRLHNVMTLNLGTKSGALPSIIRLECLPDAHQSDKPFIKIGNREGRPLSLSRSDRALVTTLALDTLQNSDFIEEPSHRELNKPAPQVIEACQRITQEGMYTVAYTDPQGVEWSLSIDRDHDSEGGFVLMLHRPTDQGSAILGHTFSSEGSGYSTLPTEMAVQLYAAIQQL